ncbi:MAG: hypothetical protein LBG12_04920 [Synergistaceae bacterium]|jgi:hypothetical protein|nr:hypothetical protein [Synergistaceae bacterium]
MWHIPLRASERTLLKVAETFGQFESLLRFFSKLDCEDNDAWWETAASAAKYSEYAELKPDSDTCEDEDDYDAYNIVAPLSFEIEKDMRTSLVTHKGGTVSVLDCLDRLAGLHPLLGMAVPDENTLKTVEKTALEAIKIALDHRKVPDFAHLAIFMIVIQYAKSWERTGNSGFWAYICEQLGYKYSEKLYEVFTNSVKVSCESYNRFFVIDLNGGNSYYSTVLAHALAPAKSFYALCDFLVKFYKNNLDCSVYADDPAIDRMVVVLRDRCQGATIEQDEDIRGNVNGIQIGLRALLMSRPGYMRHLLTKTLQKIGSLFSGDELPGKDYLDVLLTQWFIGKLAEPTVRRGAPTHKRTADIAFSYGKIRVEYTLDDNDEPAIRIPSIRLANRENPVLVVYCGNWDVYKQTIGIYGNDYAATSEEVIIPLSDINEVDFTKLRVELSVSGKPIYVSDRTLCAKALMFKGNKALTGKSIDEGNYVLFASKSVSIRFQGNIERRRRSYFAQLYDIFVQGEVSVFTDDELMCCSRPPEGSLRLKLPQSQLEYVNREVSFPLYSREMFTISAVGNPKDRNITATTQNGEKLALNYSDSNVYQIGVPDVNGCHEISLTESNSGRVLDEARFYIVDGYSINFDKPYYLETSDEGNLAFEIDGKTFEMPLMGLGAKANIPYDNGEIHIKIPRVRLLLNGKSLPKDAVWKGDISPSSSLRILCPESLPVSVSVGDTRLPRTSVISGFEFAFGNGVQSYDGTAEKLPVELLVAGDRHHMFDIFFKMSMTEPPIFNLNGSSLIWANSHVFIGDSNARLRFVFQSKLGTTLEFAAIQGERVLSSSFPTKAERYGYKIFAVTETAFGTTDTFLAEGSVIFGDRAAVILRGETLRITRVLEEGNYTEIKPVFIEEIDYVGTENLGYADLSGDYAHYTGKMFFFTREGKRYFTYFNPVDIYLVNEHAGRIHISFGGGEGLFVDKRDDYEAELYKHVDPPRKLASYFFIPDFFEFQCSKEMY